MLICAKTNTSAWWIVRHHQGPRLIEIIPQFNHNRSKSDPGCCLVTCELSELLGLKHWHQSPYTACRPTTCASQSRKVWQFLGIIVRVNILPSMCQMLSEWAFLFCCWTMCKIPPSISCYPYAHHVTTSKKRVLVQYLNNGKAHQHLNN